LQYALFSANRIDPDRKGSADKQNIDDLKKEYKMFTMKSNGSGFVDRVQRLRN